MKKYNKLAKFLFIVLAVVMIAAVPAEAMAAEDVWMAGIPEEVQDVMKAQGPAVEAYNKLFDTFELDERLRPIYPDEYAGEYIDPDRGYVLVIMLANATEEMKAKYLERTGNSKHVIFEDAKYSYNYLETLEKYALELIDAGVEIMSFGVSVKLNEYNIRAYSDNENVSLNEYFDGSKVYREIVDLPIKIELQATRSELLAGAVVGGDKMDNYSKNLPLTIGIGGLYNGVASFVTAGHGNNPLGDPNDLRNGNNPTEVIGTMVVRNFKDGAYGDYSIVNLASGFSTTNLVKYSSMSNVNISGTVSWPAIGTTVIKYGRTTEMSSGPVVANNVTFAGEPGKCISGLIKINLSHLQGANVAASGDSGGPVYFLDTSSGSSYGYYLNGINTARGEIVNQPDPNKPGWYYTELYATSAATFVSAGFTVRTW